MPSFYLCSALYKCDYLKFDKNTFLAQNIQGDIYENFK